VKTVERVRQHIEKMPVGEPFTPVKLLSLGNRAAVYKSLTRLVQSGTIMRVSHGIFVRPEESKYGKVPPTAEKVAALKANGAPIEVHGAEAARRFGLSTQVPVQPVYCTTGPSRRFLLGNLPITLQHVSARKILSPGTNVGLAFSALWYLGKEQVNTSVFEQIRSKLTTQEYKKLKQFASAMPAWMANALGEYERQSNHA
jgi:hypothetical protein